MLFKLKKRRTCNFKIYSWTGYFRRWNTKFKSKKEAKENSLAKLLFEDDNVLGVFIGKDFITITKSSSSIGNP